MAKTPVSHTCGHQQTHNLIGPSRDRVRKENWLQSTLCSACYGAELERKRQVENAQAASAAQEFGLPDLTGTPKQIDWATTLRQEALTALLSGLDAKEVDRDWLARVGRTIPAVKERVDQILREADERPEILRDLVEPLKAAGRAVLYEVIAESGTASWWIDHRYDAHRKIDEACRERAIAAYSAVIQGENPAEIEQRRLAEERCAQALRDEDETRLAVIRAEATVLPENAKTSTIALIRVDRQKQTCAIVYPEKNDHLLAVAHHFDSVWNKASREHQFAVPCQVERLAADLMRRLLAAGFPVRCDDAEIRQLALSGEFRPWSGRWVRMNPNDESEFLLMWLPGEDYYQEIRGLRARKTGRGRFAVKATAWERVADFAMRNRFEFTPRAQRRLDAERKEYESLLPQPVGPVQEPEHVELGRPSLDPASVSAEPAASLLDDED